MVIVEIGLFQYEYEYQKQNVDTIPLVSTIHDSPFYTNRFITQVFNMEFGA